MKFFIYDSLNFLKTFSCTGWRIGFALGAENLIKPMIASQQWLNFNVNRPAQVAMAKAMKNAVLPYENYQSYYHFLNHLFKKKGDELVNILKQTTLDFRVFEPDGGYFVMVDTKKSQHKIPVKYFYKEGKSNDCSPIGENLNKYNDMDYPVDFAYSYWMTHDIGVTPMPVSFFYHNNKDNKNANDYCGTDFLRFSICKNDETLKSVKEILLNHKLWKNYSNLN